MNKAILTVIKTGFAESGTIFDIKTLSSEGLALEGGGDEKRGRLRFDRGTGGEESRAICARARLGRVFDIGRTGGDESRAIRARARLGRVFDNGGAGGEESRARLG